MSRRLRDRKKVTDEEEYNPEADIARVQNRDFGGRKKKYMDFEMTDYTYGQVNQCHLKDMHDEKRLQQELDNQKSEDEHLSVAEASEHESDRMSKSESESDEDAPPKKNAKKEPGPLDLEIEIILGERKPTLAEYH